MIFKGEMPKVRAGLQPLLVLSFGDRTICSVKLKNCCHNGFSVALSVYSMHELKKKKKKASVYK